MSKPAGRSRKAKSTLMLRRARAPEALWAAQAIRSRTRRAATAWPARAGQLRRGGGGGRVRVALSARSLSRWRERVGVRVVGSTNPDDGAAVPPSPCPLPPAGEGSTHAVTGVVPDNQRN